MIRLHLPFEPIPKKRPRFKRGVGVYTPKETVEYEARIKNILLDAKLTPLKGALKVKATFVCSRPQSTPKRMPQRLPKVTRPDLDNLLKSLLDGMEGTVYKNDNQVVEIHAVKALAALGEEPHVLVEISRIKKDEVDQVLQHIERFDYERFYNHDDHHIPLIRRKNQTTSSAYVERHARTGKGVDRLRIPVRLYPPKKSAATINERPRRDAPAPEDQTSSFSESAKEIPLTRSERRRLNQERHWAERELRNHELGVRRSAERVIKLEKITAERMDEAEEKERIKYDLKRFCNLSEMERAEHINNLKARERVRFINKAKLKLADNNRKRGAAVNPWAHYVPRVLQELVESESRLIDDEGGGEDE